MLNSEYLKNLNKAQKEAVTYLDGPLLIVAGAGSGKTKVLTTRIANIIKEKKAYPNQILAVTFTNKAAKEMQIRVSKILGSSAVPWSMIIGWLAIGFDSPPICNPIRPPSAFASSTSGTVEKNSAYLLYASFNKSGSVLPSGYLSII